MNKEVIGVLFDGYDKDTEEDEMNETNALLEVGKTANVLWLVDVAFFVVSSINLITMLIIGKGDR
jgi:hypothetical protein